jgi:hypothetical protein
MAIFKSSASAKFLAFSRFSHLEIILFVWDHLNLEKW